MNLTKLDIEARRKLRGFKNNLNKSKNAMKQPNSIDLLRFRYLELAISGFCS